MISSNIKKPEIQLWWLLIKLKTFSAKTCKKNLKSNPKTLYVYVRSKYKTKDSVGPIKDEFSETILDNQQICELLNQYFISVLPAENYGNIPEVISANPSNNFIENFDTDNKSNFK